MRKSFFLTAITAAMILTTAACQNKTNTDNSLPDRINGVTTTPNGYYLKAKINGKEWAAAKMIPEVYESEIVQIMGSNDKTSLSIQLNEPTPGKTDAFIETDLNNWTDEKHDMYMIKTGETVISKMDDKWIEGTFHFTAKDDRSGKTIEVTDGSFRIANPKQFNK